MGNNDVTAIATENTEITEVRIDKMLKKDLIKELTKAREEIAALKTNNNNKEETDMKLNHHTIAVGLFEAWQLGRNPRLAAWSKANTGVFTLSLSETLVKVSFNHTFYRNNRELCKKWFTVVKAILEEQNIQVERTSSGITIK